MEEYLAELDAKSRPRAHMNLPWGAMPDVLPPESEPFQVRWSSARLPVIERAADEVHVDGPRPALALRGGSGSVARTARTGDRVADREICPARSRSRHGSRFHSRTSHQRSCCRSRMTERFFCSEKARNRSELLFGTATRVQDMAAHRIPRRVATRMPSRKAHLPDSVKQQLDRLVERQPFLRPLLIRQSYRRSDRMRCFIVQSPEIIALHSRAELSICEELDNLDLASLMARAEPFHEPMYLVCTHGNHDKCCAKFGIPVYKAAQEMAGESGMGVLACRRRSIRRKSTLLPARRLLRSRNAVRCAVDRERVHARRSLSRQIPGQLLLFKGRPGGRIFPSPNRPADLPSTTSVTKAPSRDGVLDRSFHRKRWHSMRLRSAPQRTWLEILTCKSEYIPRHTAIRAARL